MDRFILGRLGRAVALCGLLLFGAGAANAETTVTMWTFLDIGKDNPRSQALKMMVEKFEAANPDIKIEVQTQDFATMPPRFFLGHQQGRNPDVVWIDAKNIGGLLQSGGGADLNELIVSKWPDGAEDDFFVTAGWNHALDSDGVRRAVPLFHGAGVIFFRKDLFREAGIDLESVRTWDGFMEAAKQLTKDNDGDGVTDVYGVVQPLKNEKTEPIPALISSIELAGGIKNMIDPESCEPSWANENGVKSIELNVQMMEDGVTPQEAFIHTTDDVMELFQSGRAATAMGSSLRYARTVPVAQFDPAEMAFLPWPTWSGDKAGPTSVSGWWVTVWEDSPNKEAAAKWVEYMISPEAVKLWSLVGGQVPTRLSVFEEAEFDDPKYDYLKQLRDMWSQSSWMFPSKCNTVNVQPVFNEAVQAVSLGDSEPMDALKDAQRKFNDVQ